MLGIVKRSCGILFAQHDLNDVIVRKHSLMGWKVEDVYSRSAATYRIIRGHVELQENGPLFDHESLVKFNWGPDSIQLGSETGLIVHFRS